MSRSLTWLLLVSLAVGPAAALSSLRFAAQAEGAAAAITGAGGVVIRIRDASPEQALTIARTIAGRLNELAEQGTAAAAFASVKQDDGFALTAGATRICLVTPAAAQRAGSTPEALAASWLANLKRAFEQPYLSVPGETIEVALGEDLGLPIRGQPPNLAVTIDGIDGAAVTATVTPDGLRLSGAAVGLATVRLRRGAASLSLPVRIKQRAGRVRLPIETTVTGTGTDAETIRAAVTSAIFANCELQPGAAIDWQLPTTLTPPAVAGVSSVSVEVTLSGGDYLTTRQTVPVTLRGAAWGDQPADRLLVSNKPESVAGTQLLLRAPLPREKRSRLLYHHKTIAPTPLIYELRLLNEGDETAQVHVRDAHAGPSRDEMWVGHLACRDYWAQRLNMRGAVLTIPPRTAWTLVSVATPPQQVFSGLSEFAPLVGDAVEVQVVATAGREYRGPARIDGTARAAFSDEFIHETAFRSVTQTYRPPSVWAFLNIGRDPITSLNGNNLLGNFGVEYGIELTYENPDPVEARFELTFSADGGVARGIVVIDGQVVETGLVRPSEQERLLDFTLPPGGRRSFRLRILPQSGSNYPLRLVGRPFQRGWSGRGAGP